jgi:glycosyltransferase involved in cell wall biosynthesis
VTRDHSRLFIVGDRLGWSIDDDRTRLTATAERLGYDVASNRFLRLARRQSVFQHNHFNALQARWLDSSHRIGLSYFHGRPGTPGYPEFDRAYEALRKSARRIDRIQVTHAEMHELVLEAEVPADFVVRLPLGVDLEHFPLGSADACLSSRRELGLPASAFVAGSFQKDGVGWEEGLEPKLIKGPDVLVAALERLRELVPELVVLLTGPARGYVRKELERRAIPYRHVRPGSRRELARAYHALDVYLVSARQEGGPKAALEAMAAGAPLVTTRVGQAQELVHHRCNGLLVEVDDADALGGWAARVAEDAELATELRSRGRETAEAHALGELDARWGALLEGLVDRTDEDDAG